VSTRKIRLKTTLHALEEGAILEINDLPAGNKLPRYWNIDVDGKERGIREDEAELIDDD
jgi:hypothetical protein